MSTTTNISVVLDNTFHIRNAKDNSQLLFLAVILQALLDATKPKLSSDNEEIILDRLRARAWFSSSVGVTCEDFRTVCECAGVDPSYTKTFAYKVLESGEIPFIRKRINTILSM